MDVVDFKPSQVVLVADPLPLGDCFHRAENELAAAVMVAVLARRDDRWGAVSPKNVADFIDEMIRAPVEPWGTLNACPFLPRPDVYSLVKQGYATWTGEPGADVEFTPLGIARLRRWVR